MRRRDAFGVEEGFKDRERMFVEEEKDLKGGQRECGDQGEVQDWERVMGRK